MQRVLRSLTTAPAAADSWPVDAVSWEKGIVERDDHRGDSRARSF
jgi:hypothetical protein